MEGMGGTGKSWEEVSVEGGRDPDSQCGAGVEGGDGVLAIGREGGALGLGGRCFHFFTVTRAPKA